jgi:DNA repair exonuclease SbcCD ATPase subunit
MSPIGRVFIVFNLALSGAFVYFAGTYLQKQDDYKQKWTQATKQAAEEKANLTAQIERLSTERSTLEVAKTQKAAELNTTQNRLEQAIDENKTLSQQLSAVTGDVKSLLGIAQANTEQAKAAMEKATQAFNDARSADNERDVAVRAKDQAAADSRAKSDEIAKLKETIDGKDLDIAKLETERSEDKMLIKIAEQNGFIVGLAAPELAGTVLHVANNRLCTIKITDNPGEVDIADQLSKRKFSFGIYDDTGYKGEARATKYYPDENAVTCTITTAKGAIQTGDKASTKMP